MASIKYIDVRKGMVLVGEDGSLMQCLERDLNTPGNWRAILYLKMRNLKTGSITDNRYKPDDKAELAYLDTREMQYSYRDGDSYIFMDTETFEQTSLKAEFVGEQMVYLKENDTVRLTVFDGKPLSVELPATVELKVTETEPGIKGATAQAQYKGAVVETGLKINVPPFINQGDIIKIDTRTGEYLGRHGK
ncbi:elongation factor P [Telmatocola sphagniphila]|uniref:Elongation factor P n=1 Tax=Telmatocola sphagniphila TaxID=1123043 RepID=A0A8E6B9D4_9BACT|nr:elongation factor P [Telmatocola sphagniphila]QVL34605.1 elongation factor P [Telmatocola sphagniphila]